LPALSNCFTLAIIMRHSAKPQAARIIAHHKISPTSAILQLEKNFDYLPGQVLGLALSPTAQARWYSIASSPQQTFLEVLYTVQPTGELSPRLYDQAVGSQVYLWPARGNFGHNLPPQRPMYWIANGTGIAPFISLLRSGISNGATLLHGVRNFSEAYYHTECQAYNHINYLPCVSNDTSGFEGDYWPGRLTTFLTQEPPPFSPQGHFLICGSNEMVITVRELLISKGISHESIVSEIYF
jgi:ferredoxin/flavodoxin---NADP+ reductase